MELEECYDRYNRAAPMRGAQAVCADAAAPESPLSRAKREHEQTLRQLAEVTDAVRGAACAHHELERQRHVLAGKAEREASTIVRLTMTMRG